MVQPSNQNLEKTFSFKLNSLIKLKLAIECLRDSEFNPEGVASIEVTEKRFEITVLNADTEVSGYLGFKSSGLIDYYYCNNKPFSPKIISLNQISQLLVNASDHDSITIFHLDGSSNLSFTFGSDPDTELKVELLQPKAEDEIVHFPDLIFFSEAIILSEALMKMVNHLETNRKDELVSLIIAERAVYPEIGNVPLFDEYESQMVATRGMSPGQTHQAWFQLPHLELLKKASVLAPGLLLCFVFEPMDSILIRFNFRELGDLVIMSKSRLILPNSDKVQLLASAAAAALAYNKE